MMNAKFCIEMLPGAWSKADVEDWFYKQQDADRAKHGHATYSGSWGMATGIKFYPPVGIGSIFRNYESAETMLKANCEVWKHALAARYQNGKDTHWLVGAWCAQ